MWQNSFVSAEKDPATTGGAPGLSELEQVLKGLSHPDAKVFDGHYLDHIIDEIALEGLDGITLQALAIRLEQRPNFETEGFQEVAAATWNYLKLSKSLRFYALPCGRPDLVKHSWDDYRDDRGNVYEPLHAPDDIYPYFPVEHKTTGIRGSCEHYQTRKDVSNVVRRIPYAQSIGLFGNRLIIVAIQSAREKALFGTNYKKQQGLSVVQYCMIERIGRARRKGEVTRGKVSLQIMKIPPKILFYMRKDLLTRKVIIKQNASVKFENCRCPALITVFHLPRFYNRIESVASLNTRAIFTQLNQSPTKSIPSELIVSKYGKHTLRNLLIHFPELLESTWETVINPMTQDEHQESGSKVKKPKIKNIKVLKLKESNVALQRLIIQKVLDGQSLQDAEPVDHQEEEEKVSCKTSNSFAGIRILRPYQEFTSITQSFQLFQALVRSGVKGLTAKDMTFLCTTRLEARSATRYLTRYQIAKEGVIKQFKQKSFTFAFNKFAAKEAEINSALQLPFEQVVLELRELRRLLTAASILAFDTTEGDDDQFESLLESSVSNITEVPSVSISSLEDTGVPMSVQARANEITNEESEVIAKSDASIIITTASLLEDSDGIVPSTIDESIGIDELARGPPVAEESLEPELTFTSHPTLTLVNVDVDVKPIPKLKTKAKTASKTLKSCPTKSRIIEEAPKTSQLDSEVIEEKEIVDDVPEESSSLDPLENEEVQVEAMTKGMDRSHRGDEIDEEIRRNMIRQRVDWNTTEDRLILLSFIASALFIPKYNYLKVFIYNATQIRDILLERNSDRRSAKTSLAIRRRLHYLMNQKSNYDYYVGMMGEALRDDSLYVNHLKNFLHPPQARIYYLPPSPPLNTVIDYLYKKFDGEEYVVTDTRGSLNGIDTLLFMRQLDRLEYHWRAMMFLLFCPLGNTPKKRHRFRKFWKKFIKENRTIPEIEAVESSAESDIETIPETSVNVSTQQPLEGSVVSSSSEGDASSEEDGGEDENEDTVSEFPIVEFGKVHSDNVEISSDEEDCTADIERSSPDYFELEYCFKFMRFFLKHCDVLFRQMDRLNTSDGNKFSLLAMDKNSTSPNICYSARECTSDPEIRLWTARSVVFNHIMTGDASREAEKAMLCFTKTLPMEHVGRSLQRARILVYNKKSKLFGISKALLRQLANGLSSPSFDDAMDFLKYLEEAPCIDSSACINSGILSCLVELTDHFRSTIRITESIFTLNDEWVPVYDDMMEESDIGTKGSRKGKKRNNDNSDDNARPLKRRKFSADEQEEIEGIMECFEEVERELLIPKPRNLVEQGENTNYTSSSSTNALRLLRIRLNEAGLHLPGKQFTGLVEKDFFSINLPNLEFTLRETRGLNHRVAGKSHPFSKDFMTDLRSNLIELAYHYIDANLKQTIERVLEGIGKYRILFELIDMAGNQGLSAKFLLTKFTRTSLEKGLHYLVNSKLIFSVGVIDRKFVTFNNSKNWLIAIRSQSNKEVVGHAVMRPWLTAHGAISWITVNRLIIALLGQLQKSSTDLDEICQLLKPILSPVEALILIEVLVKIKFLMVYKLKEPEPELFSTHPLDKFEIEYHVDTLINTEHVFVAISPYTTFLHAQLQEAILSECSSKAVRK